MRSHLYTLLTIFLLTISFGYKSFAQSCITTPPAATGLSAAEWNEKYSVRAVYCMRENIQTTTTQMIGVMVTYVQPAFAALVVFAMIILAIKMMGGGTSSENLRGDLMSFLIKLGVIAFMMQQSQMNRLVDILYGTSDQILDMLAAGTQSTFLNVTTHCNASQANIGNLDNWYILWEKFDCIFKRIVGLGTKKNVAVGLAWVLGAAVFTGSEGITLVMVGLSLIIAFMRFLFHCITGVIFAYGALGLLIILFPLFLPLIFFKVTENYIWNAWLKMVLAQIIKPAFTLFFFMFALAILEPLIFDGSTNTYISYNNSAQNFSVEIMTSSQNPGGQYEQAIKPLFTILGVDPTASVDVQNEQLAQNIRRDQPLFSFKFNNDLNFLKSAMVDCGDKLGQNQLENNEIFNKDPSLLNEFLKLFRDPAEARKNISEGLQNLSESARLKFKSMYCAFGNRMRQAGNVLTAPARALANASMNLANYALNLGTIKVPTLDLTRSGPGQQMSVNAQGVNRKLLMQVVAVLAALYLLTNSFLFYIGRLPQVTKAISGSRAKDSKVSSPQTFENAVKGITTKGMKVMGAALHTVNRGAKKGASKLLGGGGKKKRRQSPTE